MEMQLSNHAEMCPVTKTPEWQPSGKRERENRVLEKAWAELKKQNYFIAKGVWRIKE